MTGRALARRRTHLLDLAGLGYFLVLGAVLAAIHPAHLDYWSRYAQAGSHAALTVIVFGSILAGHPFTESYARETTPAALWHTAGFRALNRRISAVWGLALLAGTISLVIAAASAPGPCCSGSSSRSAPCISPTGTRASRHSRHRPPPRPQRRRPAASAARTVQTRCRLA